MYIHSQQINISVTLNYTASTPTDNDRVYFIYVSTFKLGQQKVVKSEEAQSSEAKRAEARSLKGQSRVRYLEKWGS